MRKIYAWHYYLLASVVQRIFFKTHDRVSRREDVITIIFLYLYRIYSKENSLKWTTPYTQLSRQRSVQIELNMAHRLTQPRGTTFIRPFSTPSLSPAYHHHQHRRRRRHHHASGEIVLLGGHEC